MDNDDRIAALEHKIQVLVWLHAELVEQLNMLVTRFAGPQAAAGLPGMKGPQAARMQLQRQRAIRVARIRAAKAAAAPAGNE